MTFLKSLIVAALLTVASSSAFAQSGQPRLVEVPVPLGAPAIQPGKLPAPFYGERGFHNVVGPIEPSRMPAPFYEKGVVPPDWGFPAYQAGLSSETINDLIKHGFRPVDEATYERLMKAIDESTALAKRQSQITQEAIELARAAVANSRP
jgi:hypothetical protein